MFTNEKKHKTILGGMEQKFFEEKVRSVKAQQTSSICQFNNNLNEMNLGVNLKSYNYSLTVVHFLDSPAARSEQKNCRIGRKSSF